jgi:bla regulator protein blaR1
MPANIREWPGEHVQHAVLPELEHVRRADWATGLGARIVCALYWFHPLAWIARRRLILESEHACDDAVVRRADRVAYAELLVGLARRMTSPVLQTTLAMAARGDLSARVAAVLDQKRSRSRARAPLAAAVVATASCAALVLATLSPRLEAQAPPNQARVNQPPVAFASVSVKASQPPVVPMWQRLWVSSGFHAMNVSVGDLIRDGYDVSPFQVAGPDWIETESFDIAANDRGNESPAQLRLMIRALLADRFKLVVHTEQRQLQAYALVRSPMYAGPGPKLWKPATDCDAETPRLAFHEWLKQNALGQPECGGVRLGRFGVAGRGIPLSKFAVALETVGGVDRPIVDQTGLTGNFDFELTWTPQQDQLFELIQQQLGLALEPVVAPVEVVVVDRAERPSLN